MTPETKSETVSILTQFDCEGSRNDVIRFPEGHWGAVITSRSFIGQSLTIMMREKHECTIEVFMHFVATNGDEFVMGRFITSDTFPDPSFLHNAYIQAMRKAGEPLFDEYD